MIYPSALCSNHPLASCSSSRKAQSADATHGPGITWLQLTSPAQSCNTLLAHKAPFHALPLSFLWIQWASPTPRGLLFPPPGMFLPWFFFAWLIYSYPSGLSSNAYAHRGHHIYKPAPVTAVWPCFLLGPYLSLKSSFWMFIYLLTVAFLSRIYFPGKQEFCLLCCCFCTWHRVCVQ